MSLARIESSSGENSYFGSDHLNGGGSQAARHAKTLTQDLAALDAQGAPLVASTPTDIDAYCPAYAGMDADARKAVWVNLVASLSYHESTWRPDVSGGDGRWHGLLQISPATAQGYGCTERTAATLKVSAANVA